MQDMGIFSKLFGRQKSLRGTSSDRFYFAVDEGRGLRQIVFELGGITSTGSRFDSLGLKPDKYAALLSDVAVGFFKTDSNRGGPYLLVKTPRFSGAMAQEPVSIGFTFCYMPSGPVFAIFAKSPTTERELKANGGCFLDSVYSMDAHSGLDELFIEAFRNDKLTIVFADSGGMTGIKCVAEAECPIDRAIREIFDREWSNLVDHGRRTPGWGAASFPASREELYARTPIDRSPILQSESAAIYSVGPRPNNGDPVLPSLLADRANVNVRQIFETQSPDTLRSICRDAPIERLQFYMGMSSSMEDAIVVCFYLALYVGSHRGESEYADLVVPRLLKRLEDHDPKKTSVRRKPSNHIALDELKLSRL